MLNLIKHTVTIVILIFILYSCSNTGCNEETTSNLKVNFYNRLTKKDSAVGAITVYGINGDTLYGYKKALYDSSILLPLSSLHDSSAFYIRTDTLHTIVDPVTNIPSYTPDSVRTYTLIAYYKRKSSFISYECGFLTNFSLDSVRLKGKSPNDSVVICQPNVSTNNQTNYKIFFAPQNYHPILNPYSDKTRKLKR